MLSAQNTTLPHLGADIRPAQPERDYGAEPLTARIVLEAVNLREAVAENRSRLLATALFLAAHTAGVDLSQFEQETT